MKSDLCKTIQLGSVKECFFDDYLINTELSTAEIQLHRPIPGEVVMVHDCPWEGDGCDYHNFFYDNGIYRMYYLAWHLTGVINNDPKRNIIRVCYAESTDGLHWVKPSLGLCEFEGSADNNIILDDKTASFDNFQVFRDDNPACPPEQKYKGIAAYQGALWAYFSPDAIHFELGVMITDKGAFDSLNVVFWDPLQKKYHGYLRNFHVPGDLEGNDPFDEKPAELPGVDRNARIRDIRYIESTDFVNWTHPKLIDFGDSPDVPLYTNCVSPYINAPHLLVGFPSRYVERSQWSKSFDVLCGKEKRLERMEHSIRFGLAVTDCVFMCSRDGFHFKRYDEAFIRPGEEFSANWVYGDCYPARGLLLTPSPRRADADKELSMYCFENHWSSLPTELRRYRLRQDGFCSVHAGGKEKLLVTKPFTFSGKNLYANMSTSAAGYMYFTLRSCDGQVLESCEMFGDSTEKLIGFEKDLSDFAGKEVVLTVRMFDADLYAVQFM